MKKLLFILLSCFMCVCLVQPATAHSSNIDKIYENEIKKSIITGDGSAENPYILDKESAPMFTQYLEEKGQEIVMNMQNENTISSYVIVDSVLNGKSHSDQNNGGYWKYSSGAPNVIYNGNVWIKKVEYLSKQDVINTCSTFTSSSFIDRFKDSINDIATLSLTSAITYLTKKGFSKTAAESLAKWVGCGSTYFSIAIILSELNSYFSQKPYLAARDAGKGLVHTEYSTSYQGSWYSYSISEVWTNCPTAKEPASYCGQGVYKSR